MKRKYGIVFVTVLVGLLTISSATAATILRSNETNGPENTQVGSINYVAPDICLSGFKQKTMLSIALNFIDDPDTRTLLQEIIKKMRDGPVDSSDIEDILINKNLPLSVGSNIQTGDNCGGNAHGLFRIGLIPHVIPYPMPILFWSVCHQQVGSINPCDPDLYIDDYHITYECSGYVLLFVGCYVNGIPLGVTMGGVGLVIW